MTPEQQKIYQEGYRAYLNGKAETANLYSGLAAEFWSDGWEDSSEDEGQR